MDVDEEYPILVRQLASIQSAVKYEYKRFDCGCIGEARTCSGEMDCTRKVREYVARIVACILVFYKDSGLSLPANVQIYMDVCNELYASTGNRVFDDLHLTGFDYNTPLSNICNSVINEDVSNFVTHQDRSERYPVPDGDPLPLLPVVHRDDIGPRMSSVARHSIIELSSSCPFGDTASSSRGSNV